ncbi:hypothetical protein D5086_004118 [Populus alba]|uniref:Uncharacterized protein n=1 Tax=Populus alba TaxID=43335 RepID=A0ACC4CPG1_POPAL
MPCLRFLASALFVHAVLFSSFQQRGIKQQVGFLLLLPPPHLSPVNATMVTSIADDNNENNTKTQSFNVQAKIVPVHVAHEPSSSMDISFGCQKGEKKRKDSENRQLLRILLKNFAMLIELAYLLQKMSRILNFWRRVSSQSEKMMICCCKHHNHNISILSIDINIRSSVLALMIVSCSLGVPKSEEGRLYASKLTEKKENGLWRKLNAEAQFLEAFLLFPSRAIVNSSQLFAGPVITHPQLVRKRLKAREQSNWAADSNKRQMIHQATKNSTGVLV